MLTLARLRMRNWMVYRGEHELALAPTTYAIVARHVEDRDRSNWLGKSSIPAAVDWALWGRLPHATRTKRSWISRGEKSGEIEIALSDGSRVVRQLGLRGSEKLWHFPADGRDASHQTDAQTAIVRAIGMSADDFVATCYFQQGQMARLINCRPQERLNLVSGWIRLEPLRACQDDASAALSGVASRREDRTRERESALADIRATLERFSWGSPEEGRTDLERFEAQLRESKKALDALRKESALRIERDQLEPHARRYLEIVEVGNRTAATLAQTPDMPESVLVDLRKCERDAVASKGVADADLEAKIRLTSGRFDGTCPLVGAQCPVRDFVTGARERNERARDDAEVAAEAASLSALNATKATALVVDAANRRLWVIADLERLRAEARRLKPVHDRWRELIADERSRGDAIEESRLNQQIEIDTRMAATARAALQTIETKQKTIEACDVTIANADAAAKIAAAGVAVFDRAQRVIAEGVMGDIEARANETLGSCGIELGIRIVWSREGEGFASACGACGQAFPASTKVRQCGRCGAERGPNMTNKLEIDLTDRSGCADDLGGGVLQLAASSWLRGDRGSEWGLAMLDEPFGQMDAANRRAFAGHLPAILRQSGFGQAFVIAHHSSVLDALPGRIEIESDGNGANRTSTVRVAT